jgi:hypothetical protein
MGNQIAGSKSVRRFRLDLRRIAGNKESYFIGFDYSDSKKPEKSMEGVQPNSIADNLQSIPNRAKSV